MLTISTVCPNQDTLLDALEAEQWSKEKTAETVRTGEEEAGPEKIDHYLNLNDIDIILGPADCWLTDFACVAGKYFN